LFLLTELKINLLTGTSYTLDADGDPNAAIFSKSNLTIFGNGSLTVKANYADGITSYISIVKGTFNISSDDVIIFIFRPHFIPLHKKRYDTI